MAAILREIKRAARSTYPTCPDAFDKHVRKHAQLTALLMQISADMDGFTNLADDIQLALIELARDLATETEDMLLSGVK